MNKQRNQADPQIALQMTALESAANGIAITNNNGEIVWVNRAFSKLTGFAAHEAAGKTFRILKSGHQAPDWYENLWKTIKAGKVWQGELTNRRKDGSLFIEHQTITPFFDESGEISHFIAVMQDITGHKRAEGALLESEQRFRELLENVHLAAVMLDLEGNLIYCNDFFLELTGWQREEILGKNWFDAFLPVEIRQTIQDIFNRGEIPLHQKNEIITHSGARRMIAWNNTFARDEHGNIIGATSLGEDITERVEAEEQIHLQLRRLAALRTIDLAITSSLDLRVVISVLLDQVVSQLEIDSASLLLLNPQTQMLEFAGGQGFRRSAIQQTRLRVGYGLAGLAAAERRPVSITSMAQIQNEFTRALLISGEDFVAYHAVPLVAKGRVTGVLEIFNRKPPPPNADWLDFLETLAGQAAIAIDNASLMADLQRTNDELSQAYITTLEGWVRTLELRDDGTEEHTLRVTEMTLDLAKAIGIRDSELVHIRRGALLHDIGKMAVPDQVLLKEGPLNAEEWEVMRKHPSNAFELLSPITFLRPALDIPYCHHEKWDGTGYPRGLKGEGIPLSARLFAVADVWDALLSNRPYRRAWSKERALEYMQNQSGKHFDPMALRVFLSKILNNGDFSP